MILFPLKMMNDQDLERKAILQNSEGKKSYIQPALFLLQILEG